MTRYLRSFVLSSLICAYVQAQGSISEKIQAAQATGNYTEAAKLYAQLIASGTDNPEIRTNYGIMLHLSGQNAQALRELKIALRKAPDLAGANLFAGLSDVDLGYPAAGLPYLLKAQSLDPTHPAPLLALGKTEIALRNFVAARDAYSKASEMDGNLAEAWYGLGVANQRLAEELLNHAARQGRVNVESQTPKVQELLESALKALTRAVQLEPNSARTHLLMAESLAASNRFEEAIPEYQTVIKLDSNSDAAYLGLASGYWKARQFEQAKPLLDQILAKTPKDAEANGMLADILQHEGDISGAKHHAETALAANPDLLETRVVLARVDLANKEPRLAISELQKVLSADPDGSYHFLLYRACRESGDEQAAHQAMLEFQKLRDAHP